MTSNRYSGMKRIVLAVALAAGVSGVANAQFYSDNSISRLGGDSYAYFNSQSIDKSPSAWRQANPQGLSERVLQAYSANSAGSAWKLDKPVFSSVASDSTFKQTHPNGITERELQALSSSSLAIWQTPNGSPAETAQSNVAQSRSKATSLTRGDTN